MRRQAVPPGRCGTHSRHSARFYTPSRGSIPGEKDGREPVGRLAGRGLGEGSLVSLRVGETRSEIRKAVGAPGPQVGLACHSPHRLDVRGDKPHREEGRATAENSSVACADHGSRSCEEPAPPPVRLSFGDAGLLCLHAILRFCIRMHRALFAPWVRVLAVTFQAARRSSCQHTTLVVRANASTAPRSDAHPPRPVSEAPPSPYDRDTSGRDGQRRSPEQLWERRISRCGVMGYQMTSASVSGRTWYGRCEVQMFVAGHRTKPAGNVRGCSFVLEPT